MVVSTDSNICKKENWLVVPPTTTGTARRTFGRPIAMKNR